MEGEGVEFVTSLNFPPLADISPRTPSKEITSDRPLSQRNSLIGQVFSKEYYDSFPLQEAVPSACKK
jgi:hypothetical protein